MRCGQQTSLCGSAATGNGCAIRLLIVAGRCFLSVTHFLRSPGNPCIPDAVDLGGFTSQPGFARLYLLEIYHHGRSHLALIRLYRPSSCAIPGAIFLVMTGPRTASLRLRTCLPYSDREIGISYDSYDRFVAPYPVIAGYLPYLCTRNDNYRQ